MCACATTLAQRASSRFMCAANSSAAVPAASVSVVNAIRNRLGDVIETEFCYRRLGVRISPDVDQGWHALLGGGAGPLERRPDILRYWSWDSFSCLAHQLTTARSDFNRGYFPEILDFFFAQSKPFGQYLFGVLSQCG